MVLAELALTLTVFAPQGAPQEASAKSTAAAAQDAAKQEALPTALTESDHKKLNGLVKKWFAARQKQMNVDNPKRRASARKAERKAKDAFLKEWDKKEDKQPLKHMGDLVAIFDNVFEYDRQSGTGQVKRIKPQNKAIAQYSAVVPKGYRQTQAYPAVVLVTGWDEGKSAWMAPKDYFDLTWQGVEAAANTLFYIPEFSADLALDPVPDLSSTQGDAVEKARIGGLLAPFGDFQRDHNVARGRVVLDCGKGSCGFALRLASYFPDRFAGLVLRDPVAVEGVRLGSLSGLSVLLVSSADTKAACEKLAKALNELSEGQCTVLEGKGDYPFTESGAEIGAWAAKAQRNLTPKRVVLAPNHNMFRKGYWVEIGRADALETVSPDDRPILEAVADREANRITVKAKGVGDFRLLLNDTLLDLDKEFTVVVNGKAITEKRERSFLTMSELMFNRFDPEYLWTCDYGTAVPKSEAENGDGGGK